MVRPARLERATSWFVAVNTFVDPAQLTGQKGSQTARHLDPILDPSETSQQRGPGGVRIGERSVIAAGAIVTKDVPAHELWGGVPARRLSSVPGAPGGGALSPT